DLLDEPRSEAAESVVKLVSYLDLDIVEDVCRMILSPPAPTPSQLTWAIDQLESVIPAEEEQDALLALMQRTSDQPPPVRGALARLAARWPHPHATDWLRAFLTDADPDVRREAMHGVNAVAGLRVEHATLARLLSARQPELRTEAVKTAVAQGRT